jgi:hypothetical protein
VIEGTITNDKIAFDGENNERVMHNEVRIVIIGGRDQAKLSILEFGVILFNSLDHNEREVRCIGE